jgi:hypothetical protein
MNTGKNRKKVLIVGRMPQAGLDALKKRDDVDWEILTDDSVPSLHPKLKDANAVTLGATPFRQAELDAAPGMMVVARLGVGFDAVEIPALNKRKIPLMTTGIANSVSVAEHAMYIACSPQPGSAASTIASCAPIPGASGSATCRPTLPASRSWWSAWAASARAR